MPPLTSLTASARCHKCPWTAQGKPAATEAVPGDSISGDLP